MKMISKLRERLTASNIFILIATIFGLFFVFSIPLLWGPDETSHTGRAFQISKGDIFPNEVHDKDSYSSYGFGGQYPKSLKEIVNYVNYDFNANGHQDIPGIKWVDNPSDYKKFANTPISKETEDYNFSNTATYSPVSYIPSVVAFIVSDLLNINFGPTLYLARLSNLVVYIAIFAYILFTLRAYRFKWVFFVLGLLPSILFQAATVSADPITISLAFLIAALVLKSFASKSKLSRLDVTMLAIACILLPITKPTYIFISLLALLIPASKLPSIGKVEKYKKFMIPLFVALGIGVYLIWQLKTGYLTNAPKWIIAGVVPWWESIDSSAQISQVIHHPFEFLKTLSRTLLVADNSYVTGIFGILGFSSVHVPGVVILFMLTAFILTILNSENINATWKQVAIVCGVIVMSVLAIFGALYLTISEVGQLTVQGVQGRYFLPVVAVVALLCLLLVKTKLKTTTSIQQRRLTILVILLVGLSLLLSAMKYHYVIWG